MVHGFITHQSCRIHINSTITSLRDTALTFDGDLSGGFYHAQRGDGHAGVVRRLADVVDLQHVASHRHLLLLGQLHQAHRPLDVGHRRAHCHASQVDAAAWHHLLVGGRNGESGWDSSH